MAISSSNKEHFVILLPVPELPTDLKIAFQLYHLQLISNSNLSTLTCYHKAV